MKKILLVISSALLLSAVKSSAQTLCDSMNVDTAYVDANILSIEVYNSSTHFIAYPFFAAILDANPYIVMSDTVMIPTFLSVPGDGNNGYTAGTFNGTIAQEATVPVNTLFTGTLTINDPNDKSFECSYPFSFSYGTLNTSVNELSTSLQQIFPNPASGEFTVSLTTDYAEISITDMLGKEVINTQTTQKTMKLHLENNGAYIVYIKTKQGIAARKLIVNR